MSQELGGPEWKNSPGDRTTYAKRLLPGFGSTSNARVQDSEGLSVVDVVALGRRRTPAIGEGTVDRGRSSASGGHGCQKHRLKTHSC